MWLTLYYTGGNIDLEREVAKMWEKMKQCSCSVIDTSPNVKEPFCIIKFDNYDCETCLVTEKEKEIALKEFDKYND